MTDILAHRDDSEAILSAVKIIKTAVLKSQAAAASGANRHLLSLYFGVGKYVSENSREGKWGTGAIEAISERLQQELPGLHGFGSRNLKNMRQFYEQWSPILFRQPPAADLTAEGIVPLDAFRQPPAAEMDMATFLAVPFTHHMEILSRTSTIEERWYYIRQAHAQRWNKMELRGHLAAHDFDHQGALPNNFTRTIADARLARKTLSAFKDEYLLDFINVEDIDETNSDDVDERVIETSIVANIKKFIMTFGRDFSFMGNQYRLEIEGHEQFIDLLFFNRELNALVAVELKTGAFKPAYLGQLQLYLQALEDQVKKAHENPPIGIILCKDADKSFVEYAVRDYNKPMGVAVYHTADEMPEHLRKALPPIDEIRKQLGNDNAHA